MKTFLFGGLFCVPTFLLAQSLSDTFLMGAFAGITCHAVHAEILRRLA